MAGKYQNFLTKQNPEFDPIRVFRTYLLDLLRNPFRLAILGDVTSIMPTKIPINIGSIQLLLLLDATAD
jgi:hypothetical protein